MAEERRSPTIRRRQLARELRRLRDEAGLKAEEVITRLEWSAGKLSNIENARFVRMSVTDLRALLDLYGVTEHRQREELLAWARESRRRGWWHAYKNMLSESYSTYIGLEAGASSVLSFEQITVPGLVQTEDYARALIQGGAAEITAAEVEDRVQVRLARQRLLTQPDPLRLWAVLDEAALRREVGGAKVMRAQMEHLLAVAELPRVTLQVIPFAAGAHAGDRGRFTILEFPDPDDHDAAFVDTVAGELFVEDPEEVGRFKIAFQKLVAVALSPGDTISYIAAELAKT